MLNAQLQFDNWDFETSGPCLGKNGSYAIIADWEEISPSGVISDGTGGCFRACDGKRSLIFDWGCLTNNPMFGNSSTNPYNVKFLCTVELVEPKPETTYKIRAYGRHTKNGSDTYLGEVDVSDDENCALKSITMPSNVSDFQYFVLRVEDYKLGLHCKIDDIEIDNSLCSRKSPSYTIKHDTEWNTIADVAVDVPDAVLNGEVYLSGLNIAEDKKLTIGGDITIHFSEGAHLLMWDGSKLDLWGTLTSCDNRWGGVRTFKNSIYRSFWGSELSNAVWGISSEEWSTKDKINYLGDATIESYGGLFLNNAVAIHLYAPNDGLQHGYRLLLENCVFRKNENFDPTGRYWGFISLLNQNLDYDDNIYGCHFLNDAPTNQYNFGIEAFDSYFSVTDFSGSRSRFKDLGCGICANRKAFVAPYSVRNTDFDDCAIGIANRRISNASVAHCTFNMGNLNPVYYGAICCNSNFNLQVGLSNNGLMTGFDIESNVFQSPTQGSWWTQGVNNYDVGTADNRVYLDTFINMVHGNAAGNSDGNTNATLNGFGLHYLCNENQHPGPGHGVWEMDFFVRDDLSARNNQGFKGTNVGGYLPARNTFSQNSEALHFWQYKSSNTKINYFALEDAAGNPVPIENPTNKKNVKVYYNRKGPGCPQNYFRGDDRNNGKLTKLEKEANEALYQTHWTASIEAQGEMEAAVISGNTGLEANKRNVYNYHRGQMEKAANKGLRNALLEKTNGDRSEIRLWMHRLDSETGDFLLIDDYIGTGEYQMAQSLLDNMDMKYDHNYEQQLDLENMRSIYQILMTEKQDAFNASSLELLAKIADSEQGQACQLARSILGEKGVYYPPITVLAENIAENATDNATGNDTGNEILPKMQVSPNPADYNVVFNWENFDSLGKNVRIEITNKMGALVQILQPSTGEVSYEWTTEAITDGICYYRLLIDGQEADAGHIFITK